MTAQPRPSGAHVPIRKPGPQTVAESYARDLTSAEARWENAGGTDETVDDAGKRGAEALWTSIAAIDEGVRAPVLTSALYSHIGLGLRGGDDTGARGSKSSTFDHPGNGGPG